jgi:hypothetical protein
MKKISRSLQIKIGVVLVLVSTIFWLLVRPRSQEFADARSVVAGALMKRVIQENYAAGLGHSIHPKVLNLVAKEELYVFDFNTPDLCGIRGCLYVVYTGDGRRVLSLYLRSNLPKSVKLFSADVQQNGYPCLAIAQFQLKSKHLQQTRYCYQGGVMIPVFQQLLSKHSAVSF